MDDQEKEATSGEKVLIVMRGLPSSGKSYRANQLAGDTGVIYSTDEYWYKINNADQPDVYSFDFKLLGEAHRWNQARAIDSFDSGDELVIIDNTNITVSEPRVYVSYAYKLGYKICIEEPTSDHWKEIRVLLRDKRRNEKQLKRWAGKLANLSLETHCVPQEVIEKMMWRWQNNVTAEQILATS